MTPTHVGLINTDLLAVTNLVNYVGKQDAIDQVRIAPILLRKGTTRVAFYSLGSYERKEKEIRMTIIIASASDAIKNRSGRCC